MKDERERPKFDQLTRLEGTLAEIFRQNYPFQLSTEAGNLWMDMMEDVAKMLGASKPRFDENEFYTRCFGEDWDAVQPSLKEVK